MTIRAPLVLALVLSAAAPALAAPQKARPIRKAAVIAAMGGALAAPLAHAGEEGFVLPQGPRMIAGLVIPADLGREAKAPYAARTEYQPSLAELARADQARRWADSRPREVVTVTDPREVLQTKVSGGLLRPVHKQAHAWYMESGSPIAKAASLVTDPQHVKLRLSRGKDGSWTFGVRYQTTFSVF